MLVPTELIEIYVNPVLNIVLNSKNLLWQVNKNFSIVARKFLERTKQDEEMIMVYSLVSTTIHYFITKATRVRTKPEYVEYMNAGIFE